MRGIRRDSGDLVRDKVYTVQQIDIGQSSSEVELAEFPGRWYNTVMFAPYADRYDLQEHRELEDAMAATEDTVDGLGELHQVVQDAASNLTLNKEGK